MAFPIVILPPAAIFPQGKYVTDSDRVPLEVRLFVEQIQNLEKISNN